MRTLRYGQADSERIPDRVGDLRMPEGPGPHPVAVVIHGGFWGARYGRDLMDEICDDLARRGWASWNIEYRRVGAGGGWPSTFEDVAAAFDEVARLADDHPLDPARVVTIGHSAGGHLALWAALRHNIAPGAPGGAPRVRPKLAIGQAAVTDLTRAAREGVGGSAVTDLMGGDPGKFPDRYAAGSPAALLPAGVPMVLVHAPGDDTVPMWLSEDFVDRARLAGDEVRLMAVEGGHYEHIDPSTRAWAAVVEQIETVR